MSTTPTDLAVDPQRRQELAQRAQTDLEAVRALEVTDAASHARAAAYATTAAALEREIHAFMDPLCQSAFEHHRLLVGQRTTLLEGPGKVRKLASEKAIAFEMEQHRLREAEERRAREERERLERAERERVAAENERRRREAEQAQIAEAAAAAERGDALAAAAIIAEEPVYEPVAARPVFTPPPAVVEVPKAKGLSTRMDWDFEIVDEALIPRQYLVPDLVAIRKVVKAMKGRTQIAGIRPVEKPVASIRTP